MTTTWTQTQERILREASNLAPLKVLITIIAAPFFLIGLLFGLVWVVAILIWQATWVGVAQAHAIVKRN